MGKLVQKFLKLVRFIFGVVPQPLPTGMSALNRYCELIFSTYSLPDMPSYRQAIASMIMHLGQTTYYKAPLFFALSVRKAMANQVAYELIDQLRTEQKAIDAAKAQAEADLANTKPQPSTTAATESLAGELTPETTVPRDEPVSIKGVQVSQSPMVSKTKSVGL